jgi:hypothetical protein
MAPKRLSAEDMALLNRPSSDDEMGSATDEDADSDEVPLSSRAAKAKAKAKAAGGNKPAAKASPKAKATAKKAAAKTLAKASVVKKPSAEAGKHCIFCSSQSSEAAERHGHAVTPAACMQAFPQRLSQKDTCPPLPCPSPPAAEEVHGHAVIPAACM